MTVVDEADGALTVTVAGSVASLRVVAIADGLEMVSLTQPLAWDLLLNAKLRERVVEQANRTMLGTVVLVEKLTDGPAKPANGSTAKTSARRSTAKKLADVLLRYNFPATGLTDDALRTLILMVMATGADLRSGFAS